MRHLILSALLLFSTASSALAGERELLSFFDSLEGAWRGKGTRTQTQWDGSRTTVRFEQELEIEDQWNQEWTTSSQLTTETGTTEVGQNRFAVRGDLLLTTAYSSFEPVGVKESSPTRLSYTMKRAELYTGRVYEFTYTYELKDSRSLLGKGRVELNGVVLTEESFELKKRF